MLGALPFAIQHLARQGQSVTLWGRCPEQIAHMASSRINQRYLPGHILPNNIHCTSHFLEAIHAAQAILIAVPSHALPELLQRLKN